MINPHPAMTKLDERLLATALEQVGDLDTPSALRRLLEIGLLDRRRCERLAMRREIADLQRQGIPRCEALEVTARKFCCSYEKARNAFYDKSR